MADTPGDGSRGGGGSNTFRGSAESANRNTRSGTSLGGMAPLDGGLPDAGALIAVVDVATDQLYVVTEGEEGQLYLELSGTPASIAELSTGNARLVLRRTVSGLKSRVGSAARQCAKTVSPGRVVRSHTAISALAPPPMTPPLEAPCIAPSETASTLTPPSAQLNK